MWQRQTSQFFEKKLSELKNRLNPIFLIRINEPDSSFMYCLGRESRRNPATSSLQISFVQLAPEWKAMLSYNHVCVGGTWLRECKELKRLSLKNSQRESKWSLSMVSHLKISPIRGLTNRVPQEQMENKSSSIQKSVYNGVWHSQKQSVQMFTLWWGKETQHNISLHLFLLIHCCNYTRICRGNIYKNQHLSTHVPRRVPQCHLASHFCIYKFFWFL